jgi:hypothetical protein
MGRRNVTPRRRRNSHVALRALYVLARMRRTGQSLSAAAREEHIDPRTVRSGCSPAQVETGEQKYLR